VHGNRLGGFGSSITYAGADTIPSICGSNPVRGLTAPFDVSGLPFVLTPTLRSTTLLWSLTPLNYGKANAFTDDTGKPIGSGAPTLNAVHHRYYFTGRSDGFAYDPAQPAVYPNP
jgi:hypothetical protein